MLVGRAPHLRHSHIVPILVYVTLGPFLDAEDAYEVSIG